MVQPTYDFLKKLYKNRRKKLVDYLVKENLGAAVLLITKHTEILQFDILQDIQVMLFLSYMKMENQF